MNSPVLRLTVASAEICHIPTDEFLTIQVEIIQQPVDPVSAYRRLNVMVNILRQKDITILDFGPEYGNLDEASLSNVVQQIVEVAKHTSPPLVVIDLSNTEAIGSFFIQFLIRIWKLIKKRGGRLVIAGLSEECLNVLKRSKIESLWQRYPTREAATEALKGAE
ncbi:STAS domain-containing protein [Bremerella volcania]|uniref:STAS domain-containing protein n=1 Tax=Bremerella volcania TaxID=2527984 RepID=UPI0011A64CF2|nr:STAS domain-containing protein [Bremerella volcania]